MEETTVITPAEAVERCRIIGQPISRQRLHQLLKAGRVKGSRRSGSTWLFPWPMVVLPLPRKKEIVYGMPEVK